MVEQARYFWLLEKNNEPKNITTTSKLNHQSIDKYFSTYWFRIDQLCFFPSWELYQTSFVVMASRLLALNCKHSCIWHNLTHISRQNQWGTHEETRARERTIERSDVKQWRWQLVSPSTGTIHHSRCNVYIYLYTLCISIMETYWIICFMSNITPMLNVQYILTHIRAPYTVWDYNL